MGCVYEIYNEVNGRCYIGVTNRTAQARWKEHVRNAQKGSKTALSRAIRKYGHEKFVVTPIITSDHRNNLFLAERAMVLAYKANGHNLYNMTDGGDGAFSDEAFENGRKATTKRLIEQWKDPDYRDRMIKLSKTQWTDEKRQAASERMKALYADETFRTEMGRKIKQAKASATPEAKLKESESRKRFWSHPDRKVEKSAASTGVNNPRSKLTETDVLEIFRRIQNKENQSQIARDFNVTPTTIHSIKTGQQWSSVTGFKRTK